MEKTVRSLDSLVKQGILRQYAIAGAHGALFNLEPALTQDLDVLVSFDAPATERKSGLVLLAPI
jgi:hypothetical protein